MDWVVPVPSDPCLPACLQRKADQVAAERAAASLVPLAGSGYSVAAAFADPAYAELRRLGGTALFPALEHVVRVPPPPLFLL